MNRTLRTFLLPVILASALSACGGGGAVTNGGLVTVAPPPPSPSPSPAPSPAPSPSPGPIIDPFEPVPATIFADPLYNPELTVLGNGWQYDYVPNTAGARNLREEDGLTITYDQATGTYLVTAPLAGSGTIMQTGERSTYPFHYPTGISGFPADPTDKLPTNYCCNTLSISGSDQPGSRYSYVSFASLYASASTSSNLDTVAYGTFAVVQPTRAGDVPTVGTARYSGDMFGNLAGDSAATWIDGTAIFDFDFARGSLSGEMTVSTRCFMGCLYPDAKYTFTNTLFASGSTNFSGSLSTAGAPGNGSFSGIFAGPFANELAAEFEMPFLHPERQVWVTASGVIAGKRE